MKHIKIVVSIGLGIGLYGFQADAQSLNTSDDIYIENTSVVISPETSVEVSGNLDFSNATSVENNGRIALKNSKTATVRLSNNIGGRGQWYFNGNEDCSLSGYGANLGVVYIDQNAGNVVVKSELSVVDSLYLLRGQCRIEEGGELTLLNESTGALYFLNSPNNESYICGKLIRSVDAGNEYFFPIGNENGFYPLQISDAESKDILAVSIEKNQAFPEKSGLMITKQLSPMVWRVESRVAAANTFRVGLGGVNLEKPETGKIAMLHEKIFENGKFEMFNALETSNEFYLGTKAKSSPGLFSLVEQADNELDLVNFLYVKDGLETRFIIPKLEQFDAVSLVVYDRYGSEVYRNANYHNEFDAQNYKQGTYFYILRVTNIDESTTELRNFIEIKREI